MRSRSVSPESTTREPALVTYTSSDSITTPSIEYSSLDSQYGQRPTATPIRRKPVPLKSSVNHEVIPLTDDLSASPVRVDIVHPPRVYWLTPTLIIISVILGIGSALAHHFFYRSLNVQPVATFSGEWAVRIGTGLAFITKAFLVAAATMSYRQHYWTVLRRKALSLSDIDGMTSALSDPTVFVDSAIIRHAWSAAAVALVIWCLPIAAIAPPASLTVGLNTTNLVVPHSAVPLIDWSLLPSIMLVDGPGSWADAGQDVYRMTAGTAYGYNILPMTPTHTNSSYPLIFYGPRLRCTGVNKDDQAMFEQVFSPAESWMFQLHLDPITPYGDDAYLLYNATDVYSANGSYYLGPDKYRFDFWVRTKDLNVTCQSWNTSYNVQFDFSNSVQSIQIKNITYIDRLVPSEPRNIRPGPTVGYASWFKALSSLLKGRIGVGGLTVTKVPILSTNILQTGLATCQELQPAAQQITELFKTNFNPQITTCPGGSFMSALEQLSENMTLSYFSYGANMTTASVPLTLTNVQNVYYYNSRSLLISYCTAAIATLCIVLLGFYAMHQNGMTHSSSFSAVLCSTRNPDLDRLAYGQWYAGQPLGKNVGRQKLQFGVLNAGADLTRAHVGFGLPGSVTRLKKQ